jgi:DNA polymerase III alpha subunit
MQFLSFEDETDMLECTLFSREYQRYCHLLYRKGPLMLDGYLDEDFGARTLTIGHITAPGALSMEGPGAPVQAPGVIRIARMVADNKKPALLGRKRV